jgi:hypothetical protein
MLVKGAKELKILARRFMTLCSPAFSQKTAS